MLKSIHRLSTKQFMEVMEKGRIYTSPLFVVRVLVGRAKVEYSLKDRGQTSRLSTAAPADLSENVATRAIANLASAQISAVAPKKVAKTAVLRNKIRRQIYMAVKPLKNSLKQNTSIIILAKKETIGAKITDMTTDLKNLFIKAKINSK